MNHKIHLSILKYARDYSKRHEDTLMRMGCKAVCHKDRLIIADDDMLFLVIFFFNGTVWYSSNGEATYTNPECKEELDQYTGSFAFEVAL